MQELPTGMKKSAQEVCRGIGFYDVEKRQMRGKVHYISFAPKNHQRICGAKCRIVSCG